YERALKLDGSYLPAIQALAKLYQRAQRWEPLIAVHKGEAENGRDNERRAAAHARIADIYESKLGQLDQAAEHHAHPLTLVPGHERGSRRFRGYSRKPVASPSWRSSTNARSI